MIKIFLVEDEFVVREGIKNNIDWAAHDYEFCGEASDGELAYPMIKKEMPDIVITDIRMPFMDGLELSRLIRKELPQIKIVILSGHEEFEYAKAAIQIGVEEYLLKPINGDELLQAIGHVAEKIKEEKENQKNISLYQQEIQENLENAKRVLFNDLISTEISLTEVMERSSKLELDLTAECFNVLLLKINRRSHEESFSKRVLEIENKISDYVNSHSDEMISFDRAPEGKAYLFLGDSKETLEKNVQGFHDFFENVISEYEGVTYFGGVGKEVFRLRELNESYEMASRALAYRFLTDGNRIVSLEENIESAKPAAADDWQLGSIDTSHLDKNKIEEFLKSGDINEIPFFVEEYMRNTGDAGSTSLLFRQYMVMDMYFATRHFLEQLDTPINLFDAEPFENPHQMQKVISDYDATLRFIEELFSKAMQQRNLQTKKHDCDVIDEARRYISENYNDEDLTLNLVASEVNISPNHLSAMFSQKTGQTFVKYLTDLRMAKAKELLMCTNKRSNEISTEVGYKDSHYFSYLFKKNMGCTPMQYRERGGGQ